ncbi:hypothetical protein [Methylobacterium gregans]|uniref:hypothetical protein n=1 Tax=Methylobacterium gregans TaxID=374424 RepID=UPI0024E0F1E0|nr:hypothetical protein [Methylobacterium gregans]MDQ0520110.1 hypothetical protein [Methylobacterium gregans]
MDRLDPSRQLLRQMLIETGELSFGPRWQAPMAEALSKAAGRRVSPQQVHNLIIAQRRFPNAMIEPLRAAGLELTASLRLRADRLKAIWDSDPHALEMAAEEKREIDKDMMTLADLSPYSRKEG